MTVDNSAAGLTAQLDEVWLALAALGAGLDDQDWARGTPCPGWPVAAQYAHVIGTESALLGRDRPAGDPLTRPHVRNDIGGFNEIWVEALAGVPRQEVLARFAEVTDARRKALAAMTEEDFDAPSWTPVGQADYRRFMEIRVFDCWVHEQDVRDAVGQPGHEDGPVAEQAVEEIVRALGYIVGKRGGAPDGSRVTIELTGPVVRTLHVAVDGRARVVDTLDGPATAAVSLASGTFTRLACGRVDPTSVLGDVQLSGDTELAGRVVANLAFTI
jgi:uncharacterized protein (TIGR03083 family)